MLIVSLLIFSVTISLGIAFLSMSRTNFRIVENQVDSIVSHYLIETGAQRARERLQADFDNYALSGGTPVTDSLNVPDPNIPGSFMPLNIDVSNVFGGRQRNVQIQTVSGRSHDSSTRQYREVLTTENIAWIADQTVNKLIKIDSFGNVIFEVPGILQPYKIEINPNTGDVWVAGLKRIYKVDRDGNVLRTIVLSDNPQAIAVNPLNGDVWVGTAGTHILWYDSDGNLKHIPYPGFSDVNGIAINTYNNNDVWICDSGNSQVVRFKFVGGSEPYAEERFSSFLGTNFIHPGAIAIDQSGGNVYIAEYVVLNDTFYVYDRMANPIRQENICQRIRDIDFDPDTNYMWLACFVSPVKRINPDDFTSADIMSVFNPTSVAYDNETGGCWISDSSNHRAIRVDINCTQDLEFPGLNYGQGIASASSIINRIVELE